MIGLDTNVLVRYIAQDDKKQAALAGKIIGNLTVLNPGYITLVGLIELIWVMKSCYSASKPEIVVIVDQLLRTQEILVENAETAFKALQLFSTSQVDFADCLIERSSVVAGCKKIFTFDKRAATLGGMMLIE
jgi:predicted nucleic-acid-binding protein